MPSPVASAWAPVANTLLCAALAGSPAPEQAEGAKRPRDPEAAPAALPKKVPKRTAATARSDGVVWNKKSGKCTH